MKIAYVSTYLPKQCGIATYTDYLIHGIRKVDPASQMTVVAERGASPIVDRNFEVNPCWDRNEDYAEPILSHTKGADVVHIQHEYSIYSFDDRLPSVLEGLDRDIKKVITIHCVRPAQFSERGAVDEKFAARIAALSDEVIVHLPSQRAILTRLGVPSDKIHVIPHGTELSDEDSRASRKRLELPEEGKIMLMFGFVKPHKCLHIVVEALSEILKEVEDVYLFVAGGLAPTAKNKEKDYVEELTSKIEDLGLQSNVIFPNRFFPNSDVPYLFGACDVVLFPYYEEDRSASGSFHLAIGAKKPVVASRIPKFEELGEICDELLVLPFNSSGIAKMVLRLRQDDEFHRYVTDRTEEYRNLTSWQAVAGQHLRLYNRVPG
ncbi:glycosyltransferase [candidate division TA06 bacterium]|uniref:Glycosyltransferase n=1 Tax=candidate division TA06 bacterium TaxID=2250710 RepID=A0A523UW37_UNCT6|nr:MAG: glycosyltransferase [candidate division TA06 bacterium]